LYFRRTVYGTRTNYIRWLPPAVQWNQKVQVIEIL
jgi:hypothetical protein